MQTVSGAQPHIMRIFVSYSRLDEEIADQIASRLQAAGHDIWKWDETLGPGENIARKTLEGIEGADAFLLIVSANSLSSKGVMHEFSALALGEISKRKLTIIPVLIDESTVPSYLANYFYLDISQDIAGGIAQLIASLGTPEEAIKSRLLEQRTESIANQLGRLAQSLRDGRLTLVCGAGVSVGAGVPMWGELLLRLLESMMERVSEDHSLGFGSDAAGEFQKRYGASSLILGKYLKNTLGKDFTAKVRDALYASNPSTSDLMDVIVELARPRREGKALDSIITFNFDSLIEENLAAAKVPSRSIYTEAIKYEPEEIPVYHVHGYLPRTGDIPEDSEIVFSEDAYHKKFLDSFSWSNLIQLTKLTQNTCLFVGVSLTDPNLRRLLDVAWRKNTDQAQNHYVVKKLPSFGDAGDVLDDLARLLEEQDANLLGMNVIWVKEFREIPALLGGIASPGTAHGSP